MLRGWHGMRANPLRKHWKKLDLYLVTSTEPALLIEGQQSPFNVGIIVPLERFQLQDVEQLNRTHGSVFNSRELRELMDLTGGHPYLTRLAFYEVAGQEQRLSPDALFSAPKDEGGPFGPHLRRFFLMLIRMPDVASAFQQILRGGTCDVRRMYRLEAAGLVTIQGGQARVGCRLYKEYFETRLGQV